MAKPGEVTLTGKVHFGTFTFDCVFVAKPGEVYIMGKNQVFFDNITQMCTPNRDILSILICIDMSFWTKLLKFVTPTMVFGSFL